MFTRFLRPPSGSAFLFGPRGTGKSTWIRHQLPHAAATYDLLNTSESLRLNRDPGALYQEAQALPAGSWVVIDEVQRAPQLLDEVHRLIETRQLKFLLSGSSARKLRRGGTNLLAGRAITTEMFPLASAEMAGDWDLDACLSQGTLPMAVTGEDPAGYLRTYAETYLEHEIRAEGLTRNIGAFGRFLEIAARQNGQVTNVSGVARDAGVSRQTAQGYFEILVDTLVGMWLTPWKLKSATRQVVAPRFLLFDCGVARALSGRLPYPPSPEEQGPLLETFLLNEVRAFLSYSGRHYPIHFWRTHDGAEVDLVCETQDGHVAVEMKSSRRWDRRFSRGLRRLRDELGGRVTGYGVYRGDRVTTGDGLTVLPVGEFLSRLWDGELLR